MHLAALLAAKRREGCASDRQVGVSGMTEKEIIEMAEKAGLVDWSNSLQRYWIDAHEPGNELIEFAKAVAAHEREQCARLFDEVPDDDFYPGSQYAEAIRSRGDREDD
jgi:hypothetical protein